MFINYTFFSRLLNREESVVVLLPDMQHTRSERITLERYYQGGVRLPALFAMPDTGMAHDWWMRHSYAEARIGGPEHLGAVICLRGMAYSERELAFIGEELPDLLAAEFPLDRRNLFWFGWKGSAAFADGLRAGSRYKAVEAACQGDAAAALDERIARLFL